MGASSQASTSGIGYWSPRARRMITGHAAGDRSCTHQSLQVRTSTSRPAPAGAPQPSPSEPGPPTCATIAELHVEAELHDVAVGHDVVLALHAHPAAGLRLGHGAGLDELLVGHDLGLDEAALEVGVDD